LARIDFDTEVIILTPITIEILVYQPL